MGATRQPQDGKAGKQIHDAVMEAVKEEIGRQGLTYYRIAKEAGISPAALSRLRQPGGTLKTESFLTLLHYLGIELTDSNGKAIGLLDVSQVRS
ncbi:MAG: hypothetical protein GXY83_34100 [Rhodopirellula sp.]|nr:hypothetical protein [Rhodopirellula sp.]